MSRTIYHDFHLAIEPLGDGYRARVLQSPEGQSHQVFVAPAAVQHADDTSIRQQAEGEGKALFDALFNGQVGELYRASLERLGRSDRGTPLGELDRRLRIRLAVDPDVPDLVPLFRRLIWEQMHDGRRFLTRTRRTTLVQDLKQPIQLQDLTGEPSLRILFVAPSPQGLPQLEEAAELEAIRDVWTGNASVEVEDFSKKTFRDFRRRLRNGPPVHILHFAGHGQISEGEVEGFLSFRTSTGKEDPIPASRLAEILDDYTSLRLAILNACESGHGPRNYPARGVGPSLLKVGVPAVVAMRFKVVDEHAIEFTTSFYDALADGLAIDAAMTEARLSIDDDDESFEAWATPILFMTISDGRVFQFRGENTPKKLGIRSRMHPFDDMADRDHLLDLAPHFDGRDIRDASMWEERIGPALEHFLRQHVHPAIPIELRQDVHLSIAFAAGRVFDTRGSQITLSQSTLGDGFEAWKPNLREPWTGSLWQVQEISKAKESGSDLAIAIGVTRDLTRPVESYIDQELAGRITRLLSLTPEETSNTAVRGADHALALAQDIKRRVEQRTATEESGILHLFPATPVGLCFYLGMLSRGFGAIQLYEFDMETDKGKTYRPSMLIRSERGGRR